ncbi:DUF29 domain-containing protein [Tautonia rosea]|uniref:DUF29 domain-containing protein n=1 Tax=Tautonia rosea TaxID=2728037 RepID=UPI001473F0AE|nr:DUF29 domain-containing protein [Tautonia rosea]
MAATRALDTLSSLYELDETAWLDLMADLAREGRVEEFDLAHLAEFLSDIARRDRREVESRLVVLLLHLLKWEFQPDRRTRSWRAPLIEQRQELNAVASKGVLRAHAEETLPAVYERAVERAAAETGLPVDRFPSECPYPLEQLLTMVLPEAVPKARS